MCEEILHNNAFDLDSTELPMAKTVLFQKPILELEFTYGWLCKSTAMCAVHIYQVS